MWMHKARQALLEGGSMRKLSAAVAGLALVAALPGTATAAGTGTVPAAGDPGSPAPVAQDTIVLSGGCFWGVQAVFQHVDGVLGAASGYVGGSPETATYRQVASGGTRHAESVRVVYDPARVSLGQLLEVFFGVAHDPTQLDRQGPDRGPQYRSAIWYRNPTQERVARRYIQQLTDKGAFARPIVTEVNALETFHLAEAYHQDYLNRHPRQPYIVAHDLPKLEHLKRARPDLWRETSVPWNGG